ncbi:MAG: hypothetical protein P8017_15885 [Deltaproteobacteria bacterium]
MKKLLIIFTLAVLLLVIGSRAQAGITYVDVVDFDADLGKRNELVNACD